MSDSVPFRPFAAGTQPPLTTPPMAARLLRHPTAAAAAAGADRARETTGPHLTPALFPRSAT